MLLTGRSHTVNTRPAKPVYLELTARRAHTILQVLFDYLCVFKNVGGRVFRSFASCAHLCVPARANSCCCCPVQLQGEAFSSVTFYLQLICFPPAPRWRPDGEHGHSQLAGCHSCRRFHRLHSARFQSFLSRRTDHGWPGDPAGGRLRRLRSARVHAQSR